MVLLAAAGASTPGGWRVQAALPETSAAVRPVAVVADPVGDIVQATADLRVRYGTFAFDAELPWFNTWGSNGRWEAHYPGQLRFGISTWTDNQHFQIGVEGAVPASRRDDLGQSWASLAKETEPCNELGGSLHTLWATERFSVTTRAFIGARWGYGFDGLTGSDNANAYPTIDLAAAMVLQIVDPIAYVGELELVADSAVPISTRILLRADLPVGPGWLAFDLGMQIPATAMAFPTMQLIAQVRWWPVLEWPWPGAHPDSQG